MCFFIINGVINKLTPNVTNPTIRLTVPNFNEPYPESEKYTSKYFDTSVNEIFVIATTKKKITSDSGNNLISPKLLRGFILLIVCFYN